MAETNMTGIEVIGVERTEQLYKHNRTVKYDVKANSKGQLAKGARKLLANAPDLVDFQLIDFPPEGWDKVIWAKMCNKSYKERVVIAGALLAAEYDRLDNK